jgi:hypothetical protein
MSKAFALLNFCVGLLALAGNAVAGTADNVCAQSELKAMGYYSGEISGKIDAATKAAGDAYIAYMMANNPGWAQARLSSGEAAMWCKQLAAANPANAAFLQAAQGSAGLVKMTGLSVEGATTRSQPYPVLLNFTSTGDVTVKAACFLWNGKSEVCVPLPDGTKKGPVQVALTTGRAGTYNLNGFVKYDSNGKSFKSAETSIPITVK